MVEFTHPCDRFKVLLRNSLRDQALGWSTVKYAKSRCIYTPGSRDGMIYFIESGQVKLLIISHDGKQCLASIRTSGDIIGESFLSGQETRLEMAVAMKETSLRKIPARDFIAYLKKNSMLETLVQYLAVKVSEQLEIICALTTADGEHRLAKTLLFLSRMLGSSTSGATGCIEQRISHQELSCMVGTTRPRIGILLKKFRQLGLVRVTAQGLLVVERQRMQQFIMSDQATDACNTNELAASDLRSPGRIGKTIGMIPAVPLGARIPA